MRAGINMTNPCHLCLRTYLAILITTIGMYSDELKCFEKGQCFFLLIYSINSHLVGKNVV